RHTRSKRDWSSDVCSSDLTLSRSDFQGRKFVSTFIVLTMYFSGGLIPGYMLIRDLGLMNSFWVYILPGIVNAFNIIIIRSFMDEIGRASCRERVEVWEEGG